MSKKKKNPKFEQFPLFIKISSSPSSPSSFKDRPRVHPEEPQEVLWSEELALVEPLLRAQAPSHPAPPQGDVRCKYL